MAPGQEANGDNLVVFSISYGIIVYSVYSLESSQ